MKRKNDPEKRGRYRGRRGVTAEQAAVIAAVAIAATLLLMMHGYAKQSGVSIGEQIYEALFVAQDWD